MMQLDKERTRIYVEEQLIEAQTLWVAAPVEVSCYHQATLDGVSVGGHEIVMSRNGATPDEALKNLFEAMSDAEVTL